MSNKEQSRLSEHLIDYVDKHFPKGSKKRGEVMVIMAAAFWEGYDWAKKDILRLIEEKRS